MNRIAPGETNQQYVQNQMLARLYRLNVEIIPYARLHGTELRAAILQHTLTGDAFVLGDIDTLVLAQGHDTLSDLEASLDCWPGEVHVIGDCLAPRTAEMAVLEGLRAASVL